MALTIYPAADYTAFIDVPEADILISEHSLFFTDWDAQTLEQKEIYLRIAKDRIESVVDTTLYDGVDECLSTVNALMAIHDFTYKISETIAPNKGLISEEKVGDLQVKYYHGNVTGLAQTNDYNPYPENVVKCLQKYNAKLGTGVKQVPLYKG